MEPKQAKSKQPGAALADTDGGSNWNRRLSGQERKELRGQVPGLALSEDEEEAKTMPGDDEKEIPREEYEAAISSDLSEREERKSFNRQAARELADDSAPTNEDESITVDDTEVEDGPARPRTSRRGVLDPNSFDAKVKERKKTAPARVPGRTSGPNDIDHKKGTSMSKKKSAPTATKAAPKKSTGKMVTAKKAAPKKSTAKKVMAKKPAPKKSTGKKVVAKKAAPKKAAPKKNATAKKVSLKKKPTPKTRSRK